MGVRLLAVPPGEAGDRLSGDAVHHGRRGYTRCTAPRAEDDRADAGGRRRQRSDSAALSRLRRSLRRRAAAGSGEKPGRGGGFHVVAAIPVILGRKAAEDLPVHERRPWLVASVVAGQPWILRRFATKDCSTGTRPATLRRER